MSEQTNLETPSAQTGPPTGSKKRADSNGGAELPASSAGASVPGGSDAEPPATLSDAGFPLNSFREAAPHLRRPFTAAAVKWKVQTSWASGALIVGYIDARLTAERLNLCVPHLWFDHYEPVAAGKGLLCQLTLDGITREDVGAGYQGKGLFSDAFKRAAVKFGVGVSLYAIPKIILDNDDLERKQRGQKESVTLKPSGEARCRAIYEKWLKDVGEQRFGQPLDHGDVLDAAGDPDDPTQAPQEEEAEEDSKEDIYRLDSRRAIAIQEAIKHQRLDYAAIKEIAKAHGGSLRAASPKATREWIDGLLPEEADKVEAELDRLAG